MGVIIDILVGCRNALSFVRQLLRYAGSFLRVLLQPKAVLAAKLLAAESQFGLAMTGVHLQ